MGTFTQKVYMCKYTQTKLKSATTFKSTHM